MPCCRISCCVMPCLVLLSHLKPVSKMLYLVDPCCTTPFLLSPYFIITCLVVPLYIMLYHTLLHHVRPCCTRPYLVMPCWAILCHFVQWHHRKQWLNVSAKSVQTLSPTRVSGNTLMSTKFFIVSKYYQGKIKRAFSKKKKYIFFCYPNGVTRWVKVLFPKNQALVGRPIQN